MKRILNVVGSPTDAMEPAVAGSPRPHAGQRVHIESYGCQMNLNDSEIIRSVLSRAGYRFADRPEDADVVLLNTCAVRENAEERVFGRLGELSSLKAERPNLVLGVCGCMAQRMGGEIKERAPYVDLVMGPDTYRSLPEALRRAAEEPYIDLRLDRGEFYTGVVPAREEGVKAWLTIQRGCDKFCTFCIVPFVRGRERSVPLDALVAETKALAAKGVREVTLLGQTVNSYSDGTHSFAALLETIASVEGIERVRFTSPHPSDATDEMIRVIASNPRVCSHVHLPLQSASDAVLKRMRRTYTFQEYVEVLEALRERVEDVAITTDIIVGFPGETEEDYRATYEALERIRFDGAFMFKYSPRPGTVAHKKLPDDVPDEEKTRRLRAIIDLQESISREINEQLVGRVVHVLVEGVSKRDEDRFYGRTDNFKVCVFPREGAQVGQIAPVRVEKATAHTLIGRLDRGGPV